VDRLGCSAPNAFAGAPTVDEELTDRERAALEALIGSMFGACARRFPTSLELLGVGIEYARRADDSESLRRDAAPHERHH
jgi:hypothetical protein